jgi:hypothetical protein
VRDFLPKFLLKLRYRLAKLFEVRPFLRIDVHAYCPACGHRKGKIKVVLLAKPDSGGSKLAILHTCAVDGYQWLEPTVSIVEQHIMGEPPHDPEQEAIEVLTNDPRTKNIRGKKKVNGELVS